MEVNQSVPPPNQPFPEQNELAMEQASLPSDWSRGREMTTALLIYLPSTSREEDLGCLHTLNISRMNMQFLWVYYHWLRCSKALWCWPAGTHLSSSALSSASASGFCPQVIPASAFGGVTSSGIDSESLESPKWANTPGRRRGPKCLSYSLQSL